MVDVTIRGAGIFGLSIAYACARRGASVALIDPNGAGSGASGGLVGALAPHVPENWKPKVAFQFEALIMAEQFWASVAATGGTNPGYARTGRLQPVLDQRALEFARARTISAAELWQGKAQWQVRPRQDFDEWAPASPTGYVIHDTLSARIHPRQACNALVAALAAQGVAIQNQGPDVGKVIHATGAVGLKQLSARFGKVVGSGVKGQSALLRYNACDKPQVFVDGVHVIPHGDGTVGIGSTTERYFDDPTGTDELLDEVIEKARALMPVLNTAPVIARWAGLRPRSKSRAPILGAHPLHPGQFIANGGFKIGFGMAPKVAEVMADLTLNGRDTIPDDFDVETCL